MTSQPDIAAASVGKGKPEVAHFRVHLFDFCFFCPKRRILCGRGLKAHHGEVFGIHPNSAAVQKLVLGSGLDGKNVGWSSGHGLAPGQRKAVVVLVEGNATLVLRGERLFLRLQYPLDYSVKDELGTVFGTDAKILRSRRSVLYLYDHVGASGTGEAAIFKPIDSRSLVCVQRSGAFQISLDHPGHDFFRVQHRNLSRCWWIQGGGCNLPGFQPHKKPQYTTKRTEIYVHGSPQEI